MKKLALIVTVAVASLAPAIAQAGGYGKNDSKSLINIAPSIDVGGNKVLNDEGVNAAIEKLRLTLGNAGRLVIRPSGTEPVIRVMVEGQSEEQVRRLAESIAGEVKSAA